MQNNVYFLTIFTLFSFLPSIGMERPIAQAQQQAIEYDFAFNNDFGQPITIDVFGPNGQMLLSERVGQNRWSATTSIRPDSLPLNVIFSTPKGNILVNTTLTLNDLLALAHQQIPAHFRGRIVFSITAGLITLQVQALLMPEQLLAPYALMPLPPLPTAKPHAQTRPLPSTPAVKPSARPLPVRPAPAPEDQALHACPICTQELNNGDRVILCTANAHNFHPDCIASWKAQGNTTCPVCRAQLNNHPTQFAQVTQQKECQICTDEKNSTEFCKLSCGHEFCKECLSHILNDALQERQTRTLLCPLPECNTLFTDNDINHIATTVEQKNRLSNIHFNEWLAQQPNAKQCPTPDCNFVFINEDDMRGTIECPQCLRRYCNHCLLNHSPYITCEQAAQQAADAQPFTGDHAAANQASAEWVQQNAKPCPGPGCKAPIQKTEGCNHMTCRRCHYQFCWECLKPYGFNQDQCAGGCNYARQLIARAPGALAAPNIILEANILERQRHELEELRARYNRYIQDYGRFQQNPSLVRDIDAYERLGQEIVILRNRIQALNREIATPAVRFANNPLAQEIFEAIRPQRNRIDETIREYYEIAAQFDQLRRIPDEQRDWALARRLEDQWLLADHHMRQAEQPLRDRGQNPQVHRRNWLRDEINRLTVVLQDYQRMGYTEDRARAMQRIQNTIDFYNTQLRELDNRL